MTVPADTYKGQTEDIESVGLWSLILVRPDLPEDTVYQLSRAIHQGDQALAGRLKQGRYTRAINTVKHVPHQQPHPGVIKYFREMGLVK